MHISNCEHPKRIYNKYLKEYMYVPCGKCHTCRNSRASRWVHRLEVERCCWKYAIFFTLTYSEEHVPKLVLDYDGSLPCYMGVRSDYCLTPEDLFSLDCNSRQYMERVDSLRVLNSSDFQKFLKRFRYHAQEIKKQTCSEEQTCFRYYLVGEYGETTLRPHGHGIIFTNSRLIADNFNDLLVKSWSTFDRVSAVYRPIGRVDWSFVQASAASYVAQYLNCTSHLPKVLADSKVRPFALMSRRPPIGSLLQSSTQVRKVFDYGLAKINIWHKGKYVPVVLPDYIKSRLFPKCLRYDSLDTYGRISAYRLFEEFSSYSYREYSDSFEFAARSFLEYLETQSRLEIWKYLKEITCDFLDVKPFVRLLTIGSRVYHQRAIFGVSLEYYVSRIELYYSNCELTSMKSWYQFAEDYSKTHPVYELNLYDPDFVAKYLTGQLSDLTIRAYGYDKITDIIQLDISNVSDYQMMRFENYCKYKDTSKTKKKNDYLEAHPEKCLFIYG